MRVQVYGLLALYIVLLGFAWVFESIGAPTQASQAVALAVIVAIATIVTAVSAYYDDRELDRILTHLKAH
jgi:hypothetical protein